MIKTNEELASKIAYLKKNNYMPNFKNEMSDVQIALRSFYYCEKTVNPKGDILYDDSFWFKMTFCEYQVSDEFVREINKAYKYFQIKNIGLNEFDS